jgi:hypothetical protein
MNVEQLYRALNEQSEASVRFRLPGGALIPNHFHVTEVGRIDKDFIDCGGTRRQSASCLLQTWTADDIDHRLVAGKLARILDLAAPVLKSLELPVELEYGEDVAAQYIVSDVEALPGSLTFVLIGKQTDCLAREKCGVDGCNPQSGCC